MLRLTRILRAFIAMVAIALIASSCGADELFDEFGQQICDDDCECIEPAFRCMGHRCACPIAGQILCNRRGHSPANKERGCYPFDQCEPGEMGVPEEPPPPEPECTDIDLSKCAGAPDRECGSAICVNGACAVAVRQGPLESQRIGDCKQRVCNANGVIVETDDPADYFDDGEECTYDYCDGGPVNAPMAEIACPNKGEGYCSAGKCVSCIIGQFAGLQCKPGQTCAYGLCVPATCQNGAMDPTESDIDCGGKCVPCFEGDACNVGADCTSGVCGPDMTCKAPQCDDGVRNNGETDVDCGAGCPGKLCADGKGCQVGKDCSSGVCWAGKCLPPSCNDGVRNGSEINIDCGGSCPSDC